MLICHLDESVTRAMLKREAPTPDAVRPDLENVVMHVNFRKDSSLNVDESPHVDESVSLDNTSHRRRRVVRWSVAAVAAGLIPFTVYLVVSETSNEPSRAETPQGPSGPETSADMMATSADSSPTTKRLSDGTEVILDPDTALRVGFTDTQRAVTLYDGRATFNVAEDTKHPKRPFVVNTHVGRVLAVGKRFMVAVDTAGMDVQVYEGEVEILRHNKSGSVIKVKSGSRPVRIPIDGLQVVVANGAQAPTGVEPAG
jgi:ferric-dicitrate binding protein FerR (iron transport regulator)